MVKSKYNCALLPCINSRQETDQMCRSKLILIFLFGLFFYPFPGKSQVDSTPVQAKLLTSIPFTTFQGGIILLHARLGNHPDTLNFILDTGCGGISLDSLTCTKLGITPVLSDRTIRGIGGVWQMKFVYHQRLLLPSLSVDSLDFNVSNYDMVSSAYGERINGIIGYTFLKRYIVWIDYDSSKIYIYSKGYMKYPKGGSLLKPALFELPVQAATLKNEKNIDAKFYFDTGAGLCLLLSSSLINDSSLLNPRRRMYNIQAEGLGGKTGMKLTTLQELKLGSYRFHNVPACIFDDENNITSYPSLGGLIGNDILRRFNIILNYDRGDIYLLPNTHFRDPFDYSYSGLDMFLIDGEIRVGDVMKNSPAERAGFKADDVIMAVNDNFSRNIQTWKSLLQDTGDKIEITIKRPGGIFHLALKVESIL
jgi:hypothetical protein